MEITAVPRDDLRLASKNDEYLQQTAKAQMEMRSNAVKQADEEETSSLSYTSPTMSPILTAVQSLIISRGGVLTIMS